MGRPGSGRSGFAWWWVILFITALQLGVASPNLPAPETVEFPTPALARSAQITEQARSFRLEGNFAGLDQLARELRASQEKLDGGTWILSQFYREAVRVQGDEEAATLTLQRYEHWADEHPESITAQVCFVKALARYAWRARGSGWGDFSSERQQQLFKERHARAREILERAAELDESCPERLAALQDIAFGERWSREAFFQLVDESLEFEPTYGTYYTNAMLWLSPAWFGRSGEYEQWLADRADQQPIENHDREYAWLVWRADRMPGYEISFGPGNLDWERTQAGFEQWIQEAGNITVRLKYLRLALIADDRDVARRQFEALGGLYHPPMWEDLEEFEAARLFAFADGENPFKLKVVTSEPYVPVHWQIVDFILRVILPVLFPPRQ